MLKTAKHYESHFTEKTKRTFWPTQYIQIISTWYLYNILINTLLFFALRVWNGCVFTLLAPSHPEAKFSSEIHDLHAFTSDKI